MFDTIECSHKIYFPFPCSYIKTKKVLHICRKIRYKQIIKGQVIRNGPCHKCHFRIAGESKRFHSGFPNGITI